MTITKHREIYKLDTKGKPRVWFIESETTQPRYRTVAGILDGNLVTSEWTTCTGKQGRSDAEQVDFEVEAAYKHKLTREYHTTLQASQAGAHFFKPMLAHEYRPALFQPCYAQPKLDGARCIATREGLFSRQGKPFLSVPHIFEALEPVFRHNPEVILDGELYNHELRDDFGQIMSLVRKSKPTADDLQQSRQLIQYHVYDMPHLPHTFGTRSAAVNEAVNMARSSFIKEVATRKTLTAAELDQFHADQIANGYEGSMVRLDTPYEQKRSNNLLKRKEFKTEEFPVLCIEEGEGNWSGVAKSVECALPDGRAFGAGIKGTRERAAELLHETWTHCTVRFFEYTPDGVPRFPVVIDFHNGRVD